MSLAFEPPVRYGLWVAAIAVDVVLSILRSRDPARLLATEQEEIDESRRRRFRRRRPPAATPNRWS